MVCVLPIFFRREKGTIRKKNPSSAMYLRRPGRPTAYPFSGLQSGKERACINIFNCNFFALNNLGYICPFGHNTPENKRCINTFSTIHYKSLICKQTCTFFINFFTTSAVCDRNTLSCNKVLYGLLLTITNNYRESADLSVTVSK